MPLAPLLKPFSAFREFLVSESAGGALLILAALLALLWANAPSPTVAQAYQTLLQYQPPTPLLHMPLELWVNDALMVVFFLLVGLELRREITIGELASPARLAAPGIAALGGMIVPALIFFALNRTNPAALRGWAVPVATDIAFALAVIGTLGSRVPASLKVFLTALAIIDDLGAIVVIALFYTTSLDLLALAAAALLWLALYAMGRAGLRQLWPFALGGLLLWLLVLRSGVHATLAGVALAFAVPMAPPRRGHDEVSSPASRLEHALAPWVAFLVLPVFGLANAGLRFDALPAGAWRDPLAIGVALGLFLGKQLGVFGATLAAVKLGIARMPAGVTRLQLYGAAILCGIGFTMSLFIAELAFRGSPRADEAKLAIFAASTLAALTGLTLLALCPRPKPHPR